MIDNRQIRTVGSVLVVACLGVASAWAGAFDKELGSDVAAVKDKVKLSMMNGNGDGAETGRGPVPYLKAFGAPPKRVALVSFYVWDCGNTKETFYNPIYTYKKDINVQHSAVDAYANELYNAAIAGFKDSFAEYGVKILTADEFLDTDEKKAAYEAVDTHIGFSQKFAGFFQKGDADTWKFSGAPEGYRVLRLETTNDVKGGHFPLAATGVGVGKIANLLGHDLATTLGVDAVAILYNVVQAEKKAITMRGSYLYMFGPNPVPDSGQSLYWNGHQYSGVGLKMDVPFVSYEKGALVERDYAGYAVVAKALAAKMGEHLREKTTGAK